MSKKVESRSKNKPAQTLSTFTPTYSSGNVYSPTCILTRGNLECAIAHKPYMVPCYRAAVLCCPQKRPLIQHIIGDTMLERHRARHKPTRRKASCLSLPVADPTPLSRLPPPVLHVARSSVPCFFLVSRRPLHPRTTRPRPRRVAVIDTDET